MSLEEKAIVITGAGRGIGRASALLAAKLGAAVVVNDIDADEAGKVADEISAAGGRAVADASDVSGWIGAEQLIDTCIRRFGAIHGLVNNAAICRPRRFEDSDEALWRSVVETNVCGVAYAMMHAARRMLAAGDGAIVNVTSGAHQGAPDLAAYGASKGAVASLTYCGAIDLGARGVRVNGVSPVAATRMATAALAFAGEKAGAAEPDASAGGTGGDASIQDLLANVPTAEANAPVVCFLLSDESRGFNGQIVRVERDGLSLLGHPTVLTPYPKLDTADYPAVSAALAGGALGAMQPLGISYGQLTLA